MERSPSSWRTRLARLFGPPGRATDQARQYSGRAPSCQPGIRFRVDYWIRRLADSRCRLCRGPAREDIPLCTACLQDLPLIEPACRRCGLPTPRPVPACGRCLRRPPPWTAAVAPLRYDYPCDWLVRRLKFASDLSIAPLLARLMWAYRPAGWPDCDALVPVPLHRRRLLDRGYDQATELARELGRLAGLPVLTGTVVRVRPTPPQTGLSAGHRRRNLKGAFAVAGSADLPERICLVDDVMTTGATLDACSRTLIDSGAAQIAVWCAARAT